MSEQKKKVDDDIRLYLALAGAAIGTFVASFFLATAEDSFHKKTSKLIARLFPGYDRDDVMVTYGIFAAVGLILGGGSTWILAWMSPTHPVKSIASASGGAVLGGLIGYCSLGILFVTVGSALLWQELYSDDALRKWGDGLSFGCWVFMLGSMVLGARWGYLKTKKVVQTPTMPTDVDLSFAPSMKNPKNKGEDITKEQI